MEARRAARRIEIVGIAGTGKSTLAQALLARHPDWCRADFIHARAPSHLRYFVHAAPSVARLLASGARRPPIPTWNEIKLVVYASEWQRYLGARAEHAARTTLFDQGPLFALACLLWGKGGFTSSGWFRSWFGATAARWALELDLVVDLTVPDDVLVERINARAKHHPAKGAPEPEAVSMLAGHRRAYEQVLAEVERTSHARLLRLDSSMHSAEELAAKVSAALSNSSSTLDGAGSDEQRGKVVTRTTARDQVERLGSMG